jgi:hypothetical protein
MKKLIPSLYVLISSSAAFAVIDPGVYVGVSLAGKECALEVYEISFEKDVRHPLNERIRVRTNGDEFKVSHSQEIDVKKGLVTMNRDRYEGILSTANGANALVIDVLTNPRDVSVPVSYKWIEDNWKINKSGTITCQNLRRRAH